MKKFLALNLLTLFSLPLVTLITIKPACMVWFYQPVLPQKPQR
jgi:cyclic lactone autoinducer peptide